MFVQAKSFFVPRAERAERGLSLPYLFCIRHEVSERLYATGRSEDGNQPYVESKMRMDGSVVGDPSSVTVIEQSAKAVGQGRGFSKHQHDHVDGFWRKHVPGHLVLLKP